MKRLLGLLLVLGVVGCGKTVNKTKTVERGGLTYEINSETPFTGVAVNKYESGQNEEETTFKDGKLDGKYTLWYENGEKYAEGTYNDGKLVGLATSWYRNGQKRSEGTYKNGKLEGWGTSWHKNGRKRGKGTYEDGKMLSETKWDEEGNEIKE